MPNISGLLGSIADPSAKTKVTLKEGDQTITVERTPEKDKGLSVADVIAPGSSGLMGGTVGGMSPSPVADNQMINVTSGEYVVNQPAAMKYKSLLEDINMEGRETLARGGWTGKPMMDGYAQGGTTLSNKISKIHKEGYDKPGQAYAIAKSMGYFMGGEVMPVMSSDVAGRVRQSFAIGGQVDPATSLQQNVAGRAGPIGTNPFVQRQQQLQDDSLARQRQLQDRAYAEQQAEAQRQAEFADFTARQDYQHKQKLELEDAKSVGDASGITDVGSKWVTQPDGQRVEMTVGYKAGIPHVYDSTQGAYVQLPPGTQVGADVATAGAEGLSEGARRDVESIQATSEEKLGDYGTLSGLINQIQAAGIDDTQGVQRSIERSLETLGGWQGAQALWETKFNKVALNQALIGKPPGPISEKELDLLYKAVPHENSSPRHKLDWLRAAAKAALYDVYYNRARAQYTLDNRGVSVGFDAEWNEQNPIYQQMVSAMEQVNTNSQAEASTSDLKGSGTAEDPYVL